MTQSITEYTNMANEYVDSGEISSSLIDKYTSETNPNLLLIFHNQLLARVDAMTNKTFSKIDGDLRVSSSSDPEIKQRWYQLAISL